MGKGFKIKFRISDKINDFNLEVMESVKGGGGKVICNPRLDTTYGEKLY
jgi:hypothetical protein